MASVIANGVYPVVLGSRILGMGALKGGMPLYKYVFNRMLTMFQNTLMRQKLSEYHTGYRAFHRDVLLSIPYQQNSDDFVFDNEMLAQIFYKGYEVAEITCPTNILMRHLPSTSAAAPSMAWAYWAPASGIS